MFTCSSPISTRIGGGYRLLLTSPTLQPVNLAETLDLGRISDMSTPDPCVSRGLPGEEADAAEAELSAAVQRSHYAQTELQNPWVVIEQTQLRRDKIIKSFLETGDKQPVADLLHIPVALVNETHISRTSILLCVNTVQKPFLIPPTAGTPFKVFTFIALGDSSYASGLPGFGNPPQQFQIKSGQALHASIDAVQVFKGQVPPEGGSLLYLIMWE